MTAIPVAYRRHLAQAGIGAAAAAGLYRAVVRDVHDGDTFTVDAFTLDAGVMLAGGPVRVLGINAPELATAAGKAALTFAKPLLDAQTVGLAFAQHRLGRDKYGRYLCTVMLPDGRDFGAVMLAAGEAVVDLGLRAVWA